MITLEYLRQFRIGGYATFDLAVSFVGIYLLSPLLSKLFLKFRIEIPKRNWLLLTLPIGILVHLLTGNMTLMTKDFLDIHSHYVLKILILGLLILGIRGIKITKKNNLKKWVEIHCLQTRYKRGIYLCRLLAFNANISFFIARLFLVLYEWVLFILPTPVSRFAISAIIHYFPHMHSSFSPPDNQR